MGARHCLSFLTVALVAATSSFAAASSTDVAVAPPTASTSTAITVSLTPPTPLPTSLLGSALVHLDAPPEATLQARTSTAWVPVCAAPCDIQVSTMDEYRIAGAGRPSSAFTITAPPPGERVVVHLDPASSGHFITGIVLTSIGGGATLVGFLVWATAAVCGNGNECGAPASATQEAAGVGIAVVGVVAFVSGLALTIPNTHSDTTEELQPSPQPAGPRLHSGEARAPIFDDATHGIGSSLPKTMSTPLFAVSF
jgi:hypothetical protein